MKRSKTGRAISALMGIGAVAVPVVTSVEILTHVPAAGATGALTQVQPSTPLPTATATAKPTPKPRPTATSQPQATAVPVQPTATPVPATRTYTGASVSEQFGVVQAAITVSGKKITDVTISAPMDDGHSAAVNSQAIPILTSETLQAQSANINEVSGATVTSAAYIQSLQAALKSAGLA